MKRRKFIASLGGAVAAPMLWPLAARAEQRERMRRIGMLLPATADNAEFQARAALSVSSPRKRGPSNHQRLCF